MVNPPVEFRIAVRPDIVVHNNLGSARPCSSSGEPTSMTYSELETLELCHRCSWDDFRVQAPTGRKFLFSLVEHVHQQLDDVLTDPDVPSLDQLIRSIDDLDKANWVFQGYVDTALTQIRSRRDEFIDLVYTHQYQRLNAHLEQQSNALRALLVPAASMMLPADLPAPTGWVLVPAVWVHAHIHGGLLMTLTALFMHDDFFMLPAKLYVAFGISFHLAGKACPDDHLVLDQPLEPDTLTALTALYQKDGAFPTLESALKAVQLL